MSIEYYEGAVDAAHDILELFYFQHSYTVQGELENYHKPSTVPLTGADIKTVIERNLGDRVDELLYSMGEDWTSARIPVTNVLDNLADILHGALQELSLEVAARKVSTEIDRQVKEMKETGIIFDLTEVK